MKKFLALAIALLSVAFMVSTSLSLGFLVGLQRFWLSPSVIDSQSKVVALVLPASRELFWDDLTGELQRLGLRSKIVFDVTKYNPVGDDSREMIERASLSQVDALVCLPPESIEVSDIIDRAEGKGLPVLLLENDLPNSKRQIFLGAGSFQTGVSVGKIIRALPIPEIRGGILLSQTNLSQQTTKSSLFLNGVNEGLRRSTQDIHFEVLISPPGRFAGEELVWGLLRETPQINLLVTSTVKDTSSAMQTIVEANRVGKTYLVGVGEDRDLRMALNQGLIAGLINRDAVEWASVIDSTLSALFNGGEVSSYVSLPIHALTKGGEQNGH